MSAVERWFGRYIYEQFDPTQFLTEEIGFDPYYIADIKYILYYKAEPEPIYGEVIRDLSSEEIKLMFDSAEIDELEMDIRGIIEWYAEKMTHYAKAICPVKTGILRDSIYSEVEGADTVEILSDCPYWGYVHFGHGSYEGVPFIDEAFLRFENEMYAAIDREALRYFMEKKR